MNDYPTLNLEDPKDVQEVIRTIVEERSTDVKDFDNLQNRFMSGRKSGKLPVGASDVSGTDRVGDFNPDAASGYLYLLVNNSGTAVWARIPLDIAW